MYQRSFALLQNEPEFAAPWDACVWTAEYTREFVAEYLGPRLARDHPVSTPRHALLLSSTG